MFDGSAPTATWADGYSGLESNRRESMPRDRLQRAPAGPGLGQDIESLRRAHEECGRFGRIDVPR